MLPEKSILIRQKLMKNAKIEKLKCDIFGDFYTMKMSKKIEFEFVSGEKLLNRRENLKK